MMKELPFVSITVPVYNAEDTIEVSLRTLIKQTYPKKEIIVVDDGSTDNTLDIVSEMAEKNQIVRIFSGPHRGITKGRNIGLAEARGDLVLIGEADAIYNNDYVAKAVQFLMQNHQISGVCLTGAPWITRVTFVTKCIDVENRIQRKLLEQGKIATFYAWVFRKAIFSTIGLFDESLTQAEDKDLFLRVKKAGFSVGLITGVNWRHKRYRTLGNFMKRNYLGAKTRIFFLMKHRKAKEFVRSIGLLWLIAGALLVSLFFPIALYIIIVTLVLSITYKLFNILLLGWDCVEKRRNLFLVPFFSLARYMASALGYSHGLILAMSKKLHKSNSQGERDLESVKPSS